jgi:hypothetical protein
MTTFTVPANLAFDSYASLSSAIADWLDRSDLSGVAPQLIALAEAKISRKLVPLLSETTVNLTADVNGVIVLPADYGTLSVVRFGTQRALPQVTASKALELRANTEPFAYSLEADVLRLWPICQQTVTLIYQPKLPQLSTSQPTNFLLDTYPDVYFFGAMLFAEGYLANDNRAALFKGLFEEALEEARQFLIRQRYAGPLVPRLNPGI